MHPIFRNSLAVLAGLAVGILVNSLLIILGPMIIPTPAGLDQTTMEGLNASMSSLEPKHFIFPFLAHALGTLVGAFVAVKIAISKHIVSALTIGIFFLIGGVMMILDLDAPTWFEVLDLSLAYIPSAYLGYFLAIRYSNKG